MTRAIRPVVLVHGGAGHIAEDRRAAHVAGAKRAADAGLAALLEGASALDAAVRAVEVLEDDPQFNAGTGASLTEDGRIELDAAVMDGATLRAGAVAALPPFRNPIRIARAVLDDARHVLYCADGAAAFARAHGFTPSTLDAMRTKHAEERLRLCLEGRADPSWAGGGGTVGAVAIDRDGHLAAATSTGGTVGKHAGRIGDTPIVGAGTYADDETGACSATGTGEHILRVCLSRATCDLLRTGVAAPEAARAAISMLGARIEGGSGGLILVDREGRIGTAWNTSTMTWAAAREGDPLDGPS